MRERDLIVLKSEKQYTPAKFVALSILLIMFFLSLTTECTVTHAKEKSKQKIPHKTKGKTMSILQRKPVYSLKVNAYGVIHFVTVNGVSVIYDLSSRGQTNVILPINHWMRSGPNMIGLDVLPPKPGKAFMPESYVTIDLIVHDDSEPDKGYSITTLNFSGTKDKNKSHISGSRPSSIYDSNKGFAQDKHGDVHVYDIEVISQPKGDEYIGEILYKRKINIPSTLPLWAFFNSEKMPDYEELYGTEDDKYDKAMMPLFVEYEKIQNALAKKDIDAILPIFEERNRETDMAFYLAPGTTAKRLRESLLNTIFDKDIELLELDIQSVDFHLEENKQIVSLRRSGLDSAVVLNFVNKKKNMGSRSYPIFFRYQNGKYILTR